VFVIELLLIMMCVVCEQASKNDSEQLRLAEFSLFLSHGVKSELKQY